MRQKTVECSILNSRGLPAIGRQPRLALPFGYPAPERSRRAGTAESKGGYPTIGKYGASLFDKSCLSKTSIDFGFLISAKLVNLREFTEKKIAGRNRVSELKLGIIGRFIPRELVAVGWALPTTTLSGCGKK